MGTEPAKDPTPTNAGQPAPDSAPKDQRRANWWDPQQLFVAFKRRKRKPKPERPDRSWIWLQDDQHVLRDRMRNFGGDGLRMIYSFMKGIALTTATVVIMRLFFWSDWDVDLPFHLPLVFLFLAWGISFVVLLITYEAPMFASVMLMDMPPWWVTIFPSVFTVLEFLAFAILAPTFFIDSFGAEPDHAIMILVRWFLINGIYHFLIFIFCVLAVFHFRGVSRQLAKQKSKLKDAVDTYRTFFIGEVLGTFGVAVVSLSLAIRYWNASPAQLPEGSNTYVLVWMLLMQLFVGWALVTQYIKRTVTTRKFEEGWVPEKPTAVEGQALPQPSPLKPTGRV